MLKHQADRITEFVKDKETRVSHEISLILRLIMVEAAERKHTQTVMAGEFCRLQLNCMELLGHLHLTQVAADTHNIVKDLLEGKLDPRLILRYAGRVEKPGGGLTETVYADAKAPDMFYLLTVPYVVSCNKTLGTICLLLQTPYLIPNDVAPIISHKPGLL